MILPPTNRPPRPARLVDPDGEVVEVFLPMWCGRDRGLRVRFPYGRGRPRLTEGWLQE